MLSVPQNNMSLLDSVHFRYWRMQQGIIVIILSHLFYLTTGTWQKADYSTTTKNK